MTVEEDLNKLEDDIRKLKIEYEVYFAGGSKYPPRDTVFRVETTVKRYNANQSEMNFGQKFRFNSLIQKYAVNRELWRKKVQEKEEGRGRFAAQRRELEELIADHSASVVLSNPTQEGAQIDRLLEAVVSAKRKVGERVDNIDPLAFKRFVQEKTKQMQQSLGCKQVQFSVTVEDGKVKFKANKLS